MKKTFKDYNPEQRLLFPPSLDDLVRKEDLSIFIRDLVREDLDLKKIYASYESTRGQPPYDPTMMVALLLYSYSVGIFSSRAMARACEERVTFMAVTANQKPDFRTISDFRKRHLSGLEELFVQVLRLCKKASLVTLGHVSLDGSKVKANASKHKAMSYGQMDAKEKKLESEVKSWFERAESLDQTEDGLYGPEVRGDELPQWVANKELRRAKIREAKKELERQAKGDDDSDKTLPPKSKIGVKRKDAGVPTLRTNIISQTPKVE